MRRRCTSPRTMMWSKHSRRIDLISRSAKPFCQDEAGAVALSRMPMARKRGDDRAANPIAVPDHITRRSFPRKCLGDLAGDPLRRRVGCDVDPDEISAMKPHDHKAIQQSKADSRDHE